MIYMGIEQEVVEQIKALAEDYEEKFISERELGQAIDDIIYHTISKTTRDLFSLKRMAFAKSPVLKEL